MSVPVDPGKIIEMLRKQKEELSYQNLLLEVAYIDLQEEHRQLRDRFDKQQPKQDEGN